MTPLVGVVPTVARVAGAIVVGVDPLGPGGGDVDEVRDLACEVTASSSVCAPPELPDPEPRPPVVSEGGAGSGVGGFGQLLVIVLVVLLVVALGWLAWQFVRDRPERDADDEPADLDLEEELDDERPRIVDVERPPDRWRRAAAEHRERHEYRDAIRCEYRALVGDLARAGHVDEIPGRTSGEERAQIRAIARPGSPVPSRFDDAADRFDRAWFDDDVVTDDDDRRFVEAATTVLDELRLGAGGSGR